MKMLTSPSYGNSPVEIRFCAGTEKIYKKIWKNVSGKGEEFFTSIFFLYDLATREFRRFKI